MKHLFSSAALLLVLAAGSANAAPIVSFSTTAAGGTSIQNFDSFAVGTTIPTNTLILDSTVSGVGVKPTGSTGNYASILGGGSFEVAFAPAKSFSFLLGSLDGYNQVTLSLADGSQTVYTGGAITGGASGDGYVTYTSTDSRITGATFSSTNNSFEIDNLTSSVPEPATWALLVLGFGFVGSVMRRRTASFGYAA
jgi:hypothetical protein